jgi:hypothetical protein
MLFLAFFLPVTPTAAPADHGHGGVFTETALALGHVDPDLRWRGVEATLARHEVEAVSRVILETRP